MRNHPVTRDLKKEDVVIVMCPPLAQYPKPPSDHSASTLTDCPDCNQKMWLSEKKKAMIKFAESFGKEIWMQCYPCSVKLGQEMIKEKCDIHKINL
jgi:hypothetical protein